MTTDTSTARLLVALEKLSPSQEKDELIDSAKANRFHDFKSESATPCMDLVRVLGMCAKKHYGTSLFPEFVALANRAMEGEFDATKEEADEWMSTPEGGKANDVLRRMWGHAKNK